MTEMKFSNVSNPAALGVEWVSEGTRYQLSVGRDVPDVVAFGMRPAGQSGWTNAVVTDPERFGGVPRSYRGLLAFAEAFVSRASED